jgi:Uncharacterised protein family UPF0564
MVDEINQREEYEIQNKFRANPVPVNNDLPLYQMMLEKDEQRRMQIKAESV